MLSRILVVFAFLLSDFSSLRCVIKRSAPAARNDWPTTCALNTTQLYDLNGTHRYKHEQIFQMNPGQTSVVDWLSVNTTDLPCISTRIADVNNRVYSSVGQTSSSDIVCSPSKNHSVYPFTLFGSAISTFRPNPGLTTVSRVMLIGIRKINIRSQRARKPSFMLLLLVAGIEPNPGPRSTRSTRSLRFGCLNTRSAVNKAALIHDTISDFDLDIFALTETWVVENDPNAIKLDLAPE